jgi:hypothetical protein
VREKREQMERFPTLGQNLGKVPSGFWDSVDRRSRRLSRQFKKVKYNGAGERPFAVVAAHLTRSENLDLVFADWLSGQKVILLGNGDGTFQMPRKVPATNPIELATGDFNEDGKEDLAVAENNGTGADHSRYFWEMAKVASSCPAAIALASHPVL